MRNLSIVAALAICVMLVGCKKTYEDSVKEDISCMNDLTSVLKGVKDEASANAAVPKIKAIGERMRKFSESMKDVPQPSEAEKKAITDKYDKERKDALAAMEKEFERVATDPKCAAVMSAIVDVGQSMPGSHK
jgi:uncharacterized protein YoxC